MSSKVVAIIPARAGSKRLPGKNKRMLAGKPLIAWTIEQAIDCSFIDEIIITSNDVDVLKMGYGTYQDKRCIVKKRPEFLCEDDSLLNEVILYELQNYDDLTTVILLQPTSPLRKVYDIQMAYQIFKDRVSCPVIPVFREDEYHYKLNGAVFVFTLGSLRLTNSILAGEFACIYIMPKIRSIDIDTLEDFEEAENLMKLRLK